MQNEGLLLVILDDPLDPPTVPWLIACATSTPPTSRLENAPALAFKNAIFAVCCTVTFDNAVEFAVSADIATS